jgi:hypothetical protein
MICSLRKPLFLIIALILVAFCSVGRAGELPGDSVTRAWETGPFVKQKQPVLSPTPESRFQCPILGKEVRWEEQNVYNPAAVVRDGKVYLFYRADDKNPALKWGRTCRIGMAWSEDCVHFTRRPTPVVYPDNDEWKKYEWEGGCEDLHIVEDEDGGYYMNYTTWNGSGDSARFTSFEFSRDDECANGTQTTEAGVEISWPAGEETDNTLMALQEHFVHGQRR